jgi:hypothetical protein
VDRPVGQWEQCDTQPIYTAAAFNGLPAIVFGGVSGRIMNFVSSATDSATAFTIGMVLYHTASGNSNQAFATAGAWRSGGVHLISPTVNPRIAINPLADYLTTFATSAGVPYIYILQGSISGGIATVVPYFNGTAFASTTGGTLTSYLLGTLNIGGWDGDAARTLNGGIMSFVLYNQVLSTASRQKLEGYFAWKWWGTGSVLPSDHPFKYGRP